MSVPRRTPERCYCGDPECKNCFPFSSAQPDEDDEYEVTRQQEIDALSEEPTNSSPIER